VPRYQVIVVKPQSINAIQQCPFFFKRLNFDIYAHALISGYWQ
jgi:hypothetical protein